MRVIFSVRSHIGYTRKNNEDNLFADGITLPSDICSNTFSLDSESVAPVTLAVCDGLGGEDNGEIASAMAVNKMTEINDIIKSSAQSNLFQIVENYTQELNDEIHFASQRTGKRMGTTLALTLVLKKGVYCFNIGDTRIYSMKNNKFSQITNDHTAAAERVRAGIISAEQARCEKNRHKLTKCIGIGKQSTAEKYPPIRGKCRILICSDGLTEMINDDEIKMLMSKIFTANEAADALLCLALKRGGLDNITLIVCDVKPKAKAFI